MKLLTDAAAINKAIDSIQSRGAKLDKDIQQAALSVLTHHATHGDVTLVNRLVDAMPKGSRVNALRAYIETFGAVKYDEANKLFLHAKGKAARLEAAAETNWTDFKPEPQYVPITNALAEVSKLIDRLEKDVKTQGDATKVPEELLTKLRTLRADATVGTMH